MSDTIAAPTQDDAPQAILALAQRIAEKAAAQGADSAECYIQSASGRSLSIERNQLATTEQGGEAGIGLRVIKDGRSAFAYFTRLDALADAAEQALTATRRAPKTRLELPRASQNPDVPGLWDDAVIHREGDALVADARELIVTSKEVHPGINVAGGSVGMGAEVCAVANTEGLESVYRKTETGLGLYVVARDGDDVATAHHSHEATTLDALARDPAGIARVAAERAKDLLAARPMEAKGKTNVVFAPQAISAILEFMVLPAFLGERAARGESVYTGREDEMIADKRLLLTDDPTRAGGLGSAPSCDEGLPSRRVPLLADGHLGQYLHDIGSAYRYGDGAESLTASGLRTGGLSDGQSYQDPPTATPRQIVLETKDEKPLEALLEEVGTGLLVLDVLGAHTGNRTSGDFSVTSTQLWRIENGERGAPVSGAMIAGNLPQLLQNALIGTSREREQVSGHFTPTGLDLPHVALSDITQVGG